MRGLLRVETLCAMVFALLSSAGAAPKLTEHTTVLPISEGRYLPDAQKSGCWTPSASELKLLEADLPRRLVPYYRQYLGITQRGKRLIYINGFSARTAPQMTGGSYEWHRHAVAVADGGDDFFQAIYDPASRKVTSLSFNGPYFVVPKKPR